MGGPSPSNKPETATQPRSISYTDLSPAEKLDLCKSIADRSPGFVLNHLDDLPKDDGKNGINALIRTAAYNAVMRDPEALAAHTEAVRAAGISAADLFQRREYVAVGSPLLAGTLKQLSGGEDIARLGIITEPGAAAANIRNLLWVSGVEESIGQATEKKEHLLFKNAGPLLAADPERCRELLRRAAERNPRAVVSEISALRNADPDLARQLGSFALKSLDAQTIVYCATEANSIDPVTTRKALRDLAISDPGRLLGEAEKLANLPEGKAVLQTAIQNDPGALVAFALGSPKNSEIAEKLLAEMPGKYSSTLKSIVDTPLTTKHLGRSGLDLDLETKVRMAYLAEQIGSGALSLAEAERISEPTLLPRSTSPGKNFDVPDARTYHPEYFARLSDLALTTDCSYFAGVNRQLENESLRLAAYFNARHEEKLPAQRFAELKDFSARDLYMLLSKSQAELTTDANNQVYRSTYQYAYDQLISRTQREAKTASPGEELLASVHNAHLGDFMNAAIARGEFDRFLAMVSPEHRPDILARPFRDLERSRDPFSSALSAAELVDAKVSPQTLRIFQNEIAAATARPDRTPSEKALYGILAVKMQKRLEQAHLSVPPEITEAAEPYQKYVRSPKDLRFVSGNNLVKDGVLREHHEFFNDDDGVRSYSSLVATYRGDPKHWSVEEINGMARITSVNTPVKVEIIANRPVDAAALASDPAGPLKIRAADEIREKVAQEAQDNTTFDVQRGHIYHAEEYFSRMAKDPAIVYLGACGGAAEILRVMILNPNVSVIATKGIGSATINDPLLKIVNDYAATHGSVDWEAVWKRAELQLGTNPLFGYYVPPHRDPRTNFARAYVLSSMDAEKESTGPTQNAE